MQLPENLLFCSLFLINALHYATGLGVSISGHVKVADNVGDFLKTLLLSVDGQDNPKAERSPSEYKQGLDMKELQKWLSGKGDDQAAVVNKFGYDDNREDLLLREMHDQQRLSAGHVYGVHEREHEDEPQNVVETRL